MRRTVGKSVRSLDLQTTDMISSSLAVSLLFVPPPPPPPPLSYSLGSHVCKVPVLRKFIFDF